ncbi:hypothetical protein LCGC14_1482340 [marine sediment metagenome]|uniref:Uncharacterized protein n=1 Tax=marine sediment metagenome TaxID=412755 RepID=A0A0F9JV64_9ZZZZ
MVEGIIVLVMVFATSFVAGNLAGPQYYGLRLLLAMCVAGILGGTVALLPIIAWKL